LDEVVFGLVLNSVKNGFPIDAVRNIPYNFGSLKGNLAMQAVREVATITSKGQITLPKPIRQALGVDFGGKVAFDLQGSQVVVTRVENEVHEDPAIAGFLALLEKDITAGRHIFTLPADLAQFMLAAINRPVDLSEDIHGDVAL
jgi:antitoxin PrlF